MPVDSHDGQPGKPKPAASAASAQVGRVVGPVNGPVNGLVNGPDSGSAKPADAPSGPPSAVPPMLQAPLAGRVTADATAHQVADAVLTLWADIDAAMHPIVGHRGVAAMFQRSLAQAGAGHAWLRGSKSDGLAAAVDTQALHAALAQQTPADAATGATALLHAFYNLLASLVGPALTARLLADVWAGAAPPPPGTPSAQDTPR